MSRVTVSRLIDAPLDVVFRAVTDIRNLPKTNPDIIGIAFLSEVHSGVGARFCETRTVKGKEAKTELEITEYVENERVRMVSDSHGTLWDSEFTVSSEGSKTLLVITMDARAKKLTAKLVNPMLKGLIRKGVAKHVDSVASYCEAQVS